MSRANEGRRSCRCCEAKRESAAVEMGGVGPVIDYTKRQARQGKADSRHQGKRWRAETSFSRRTAASTRVSFPPGHSQSANRVRPSGQRPHHASPSPDPCSIHWATRASPSVDPTAASLDPPYWLLAGWPRATLSVAANRSRRTSSWDTATTP